jgi:hypothetical protein
VGNPQRWYEVRTFASAWLYDPLDEEWWREWWYRLVLPFYRAAWIMGLIEVADCALWSSSRVAALGTAPPDRPHRVWFWIFHGWE